MLTFVEEGDAGVLRARARVCWGGYVALRRKRRAIEINQIHVPPKMNNCSPLSIALTISLARALSCRVIPMDFTLLLFSEQSEKWVINMLHG